MTDITAPNGNGNGKFFISPDSELTVTLETTEIRYSRILPQRYVMVTINIPEHFSITLARLAYSVLYIRQFGEDRSQDPEDPSWLIGKRALIRIKYKEDRVSETLYPDIRIIQLIKE